MCCLNEKLRGYLWRLDNRVSIWCLSAYLEQFAYRLFWMSIKVWICKGQDECPRKID